MSTPTLCECLCNPGAMKMSWHFIHVFYKFRALNWPLKKNCLKTQKNYSLWFSLIGIYVVQEKNLVINFIQPKMSYIL
jgi:hypothetical protein